jgi:hypothetical protein
VVLNISSKDSDTSPKTGLERILEYFNDNLEINHPVALKEVVDKTGLSYTYVKKTLTRLKKEEYCGFNFEQSGATWIAWKDREHILPKMDDTCSRFLKQNDSNLD